MKKVSLFYIILCTSTLLNAQPTNWKIVAGKITSSWTDSVNPNNVLPEYPRPQMQRSDWQNLNGLWQYAVLPKVQAENIPASFQGDILVPFAIESALSGVGKTVGKDSILWYRRTININAKTSGR